MPSINTVIVVDDNNVNRAVLKKILSEDYSVIEAENGKVALEVLEKCAESIGAVILDLIMPVMDGYEFLKRTSVEKRYSNIPVLVATGNSDQKSEIEALKCGACDFVSKPYNPEIIKFRLNNAILRSQLSAFTQLKYLSEHNELTGLYNRIKFFETTRKMLTSNREERFVLIRFDIDNFKLINSFFGTNEGDNILCRIAEGIRKYSNGINKFTYGHIDADVFAICMPFDSQKALINSMEASRKALKFYRSDFELVPCFGIYSIEDNDMPVDIMFDKTILAAKKCKGNYLECYSFYEDKMNNEIVKAQEIIQDMNKALDEKQFVVFYQPKYNVKTNAPYGAEALVRWIHPQKGIISPGEFIPVFERNGFICKLDFYVWEETCKAIQKWNKEGRTPMPVSVNVSRVNLYNPNLCKVFTNLIRQYNIPSWQLNLEITESVYSENTAQLKKTISDLRKHGFIILMDDFGSGYSSLNILKEVEFDILKIDMKFLPNKHDGKAERILAAIIRMAKWLQIPVVIEGVETKEQTRLVTALGCNFIQGYYFAKPMPAYDYEKIMSAGQVKEISKNSDQSGQIILNGIMKSTPEMQLFFNDISQPMAMLEYHNKKYEILKVNEIFKNFFGYDENTMANPDNLFDIEASETIISTLDKVNSDKKIAHCEYMRIINEGKPLWIHMQVQYLANIAERGVLLAIFTDITEQKNMETSLNALKRQLLVTQKSKNTILIVDDQELNRDVLRETFKEDFNIFQATDGEQALKLMIDHKNEIDLVLLDLLMPTMSGQEVLKKKLLIPDIKDIPVIIISVDSKEDVQIDTLKYNISDFVAKPFVPEIVYKRVINVINAYRTKIISNALTENDKSEK